jgi:hypothetical protein
VRPAGDQDDLVTVLAQSSTDRPADRSCPDHDVAHPGSEAPTSGTGSPTPGARPPVGVGGGVHAPDLLDRSAGRDGAAQQQGLPRGTSRRQPEVARGGAGGEVGRGLEPLGDGEAERGGNEANERRCERRTTSTADPGRAPRLVRDGGHGG